MKDYQQSNFREDIKKAMSPAGIEGDKITLLINDNQITNDLFLEDVNNILNSGEIPTLWLVEEKADLIERIRPIAKKCGVFENEYVFFVERVRNQMHIVLCLSPVGESLRKRIRMFPSLVNCCTINWFDPWPTDALLQVSTQFIQNIEAIKGDEEI